MKPKQPEKKPVNIRLSNEGLRLLAVVADKLAVSKTAIIELAVRKIAKEEGVK